MHFRARSFSPRTNDPGHSSKAARAGTAHRSWSPVALVASTVYDGQRERQPLFVRFNLTGGPREIANEQGRFETTNDVSTYLAKVDHRLSSLHTLSARYSFSSNRAANATHFGVTNSSLENNGTERNSVHTGVVSLSSSFGSGVLNEFRAHFSHESRPRINNQETVTSRRSRGRTIRVSPIRSTRSPPAALLTTSTSSIT